MNRIVRFLIVVGFVGLASACTSTFKSNVSRFHELPPPHGEKVSIVASDPAKSTSLEFASYANIVGSYLGKQGYQPAGDDKPDLIVELDYSVDEGSIIVETYPSQFTFGYGYFGHGYPYSYWPYSYWPYSYRHYPYWHYGYYYSPFWDYYDPFYRDTRSYVTYTRRLKMVIKPNIKGAKNLFEGTVESKGRSKNLANLMPHMVQAMFTNFPGVSGTTDRVVIKLKDE